MNIVAHEPNLLASCYERSLEIAVAHQLSSIAFPSISTGIYGYPIELAALVAVSTVKRFVRHPSSLAQITFCCFSERDRATYRRMLDSMV